MALVVKDRVKETTTTVGTGTLTLAGASTGFQAFSVIGNDNTTYYTITDGTDWEVGIGTYTSSGTTLSRDTILESSNSGSAVDWAAGSKDVFVTYPAERSVYTDAAGTSITPATASTLGVASGGTGQTTYTDGQLLIGNTTGNTLAKATLTAGTGVTVTNGSGSITLAIGQAVATSSDVEFDSFGVGTPASGTTGEIRATDNVTAYYSSDRRFKENIRNIDGALDKVVAIGGKYFDWTDEYIAKHGGEDGYFLTKSDFGVIAQDVMKVFPVAVKTRADGSLAVDYEKLCSLAFAAIAELKAEINLLKKD
jgi:hypothetical protein